MTGRDDRLPSATDRVLTVIYYYGITLSIICGSVWLVNLFAGFENAVLAAILTIPAMIHFKTFHFLYEPEFQAKRPWGKAGAIAVTTLQSAAFMGFLILLVSLVIQYL